MRTIDIDDVVFEVRSLRRKDIREKLGAYGYKVYAFDPNMGGEIDPETFIAGQEMVIDLVIDGGCDAVDQAGGTRGMVKIWEAIIAETYGLKGEEKNLSTSGQPDQTDEEKQPAPDA